KSASAEATKATAGHAAIEDAPPITPPTPAATEEAAKDDEEQHEQQHRQRQVGPFLLPLASLGRNRLAAENGEHRLDTGDDAFFEPPLAKLRRDDAGDDHGRGGIGQLTFQAVTNFDADFLLVAGDDQQRAVVLAFLAYHPVPAQLIAVIGNLVA